MQVPQRRQRLFVEYRVASLVFVDRAERTFHRAALALGAAFEACTGERQIAGARMRGASEAGVLHRLNGLECRAGRVFGRLQHVHRTAHRACGVNAGAARFVGEADEVRIAEAVLQLRHVRPLAIVEVEHGDLLQLHLLLLGLFRAAFGSRHDGVPCFEIDARVRYLSSGKHHQSRQKAACLHPGSSRGTSPYNPRPPLPPRRLGPW